MSFFSKILEKLGLRKDQEKAAAPTPPPAPASKPAAPAAKPAAGAKPATPTAKPAVPSAGAKPAINPVPHAGPPAGPVQAIPTPVSEVDVVKKLEKMAEGSGLDWKVSIVDLLKVLGIDSSREARNELATELGCPPELMKDSAKMNVWLHKTVLKKIAENGGNIPRNLLD